MPVVIDIRDLWPDIYLDVFPKFLSSIAKKLLFKQYKLSRDCFSNATSLVAVSESYLKWGINRGNRKSSPHLDKVFPIGYQIPTRGATCSTTLKTFLCKSEIPNDSFGLIYAGVFNTSSDLESDKSIQIIKERKGSCLILVGDGDKMSNYKK